MKKVIMSAAILMLVCCGEAEATSKVTDEVTPIIEINLDNMTFTDAFKIQYRAKGEGHTFWWRNDEYTTNLAQITTVPDKSMVKHNTLDKNDYFGWVLNNDDPDDYCKSNKLDDCGVCDGPGKITWFRDKDGDGLGTFMEWITSCTYPKPEEIEKYYEESPLEGGGDQGVNR